jgi:hypothetical protein
VIVGHKALGVDVDVLLSRCVDSMVLIWSKIGRRRKMQLLSKNRFDSGTVGAIMETFFGTSLRRTVREFQGTPEGSDRHETQPLDALQWLNASKTIVQPARHTFSNAHLVQRLMFQ